MGRQGPPAALTLARAHRVSGVAGRLHLDHLQQRENGAQGWAAMSPQGTAARGAKRCSHLAVSATPTRLQADAVEVAAVKWVRVIWLASESAHHKAGPAASRAGAAPGRAPERSGGGAGGGTGARSRSRQRAWRAAAAAAGSGGRGGGREGRLGNAGAGREHSSKLDCQALLACCMQARWLRDAKATAREEGFASS